MLYSLLDKSLHKKILLLTLPMVLSNITIPLLGLVDTAVIGHLEQAWFLGGVAVGNMMINIIMWLFGFLRMSTTGMTAQAYGARDNSKQVELLLQGLFLAIVLGLFLLIISKPISTFVLSFNTASDEIKFYANQYFLIRILSTPAALSNLVIIGWLLGRQRVKQTMYLLVLTNFINIVLDIIFVIILKWQVIGVAFASVIADYIGFILALYFVYNTWSLINIFKFKKFIIGIEKLFQLNFDIFLRSICLQLVFSFMIFYGSSLSDNIAAANAVLMSFLMLVSYAIDGFAYTMEALVGEAIGGKNKHQLVNSMLVITFWSVLIALFLTFVFTFNGERIINLISSIENVQMTAMEYLPWLTIFPIVSIWCFLLDGIFVGAAKGRQMRNSMVIASSSFFITWFITQSYANHALWGAMLIFMAVRAVILSLNLKKIFNY